GAAAMAEKAGQHCLIRYEHNFDCSCGKRLAAVWVSWDFAQGKWSEHIRSLAGAVQPPQDKALAKLERYETALKSIAANTCCDNCQEAALVARAALQCLLPRESGGQ